MTIRRETFPRHRFQRRPPSISEFAGLVRLNQRSSFSLLRRSGHPNVFRYLSFFNSKPRRGVLPRISVDRTSFVPTPESIPPPDVSYRQKAPPGLPVHKHPLVRHLAPLNDMKCNRFMPESLGVSPSCRFDISRPHCHRPS